MDPFVTAFYHIDTDEDEVITIRDLEQYVEENNLDRSMVNKWRNLFDKNNTGRITLSNFCEVLGLRLSEVRIQRMQSLQKSAPGIRKEIQVISSTMAPRDQATVANELYRLASDKRLEKKQVADELKKYLDAQYGRMWHVIVSTGSSWNSFSYCPNTTLFCQIENCVYLIWRTPE